MWRNWQRATGQTSQIDARTQHGNGSGWGAALSLRPDQGGGEEGWNPGGLGFPLLGHGWSRWHGDAAPSLRASIPNSVTQHTSVSTNTGPARAWRAPDHPQAAALTMCALEDLAAKLNMDPIEFFSKNADLSAGRGKVYREEFQKAAEIIDWQKNWHPRGDKTSSHIKRGMGISMHTWGGRGHNSNCNVTIHPDGSVEVNMGTQDLGTGTRTAIVIVAAETLGLPIEAITRQHRR